MAERRTALRVAFECVIVVLLFVAGYALRGLIGGGGVIVGTPLFLWIGVRVWCATTGRDPMGKLIEFSDAFGRAAQDTGSVKDGMGRSASFDLGSNLFALLGMSLLLYSFVLVGSQCWHWLRTAEWVPVPAEMLTISDEERSQAEPLPIRLVPALGPKPRPEGWHVKPEQLLGWEKIKSWLWSLPLAIWTFLVGCFVFLASVE